MSNHTYKFSLFAGTLALLGLGLISPTALGDNEIESFYLNQPFKTNQPATTNLALRNFHRFEVKSSDKLYESLKFSKDFKIRGWEVAEGVYMGQAKIAGKSGPGVIFQREGYSWGFNHRGVQLHIPL